MRRSLVPYSAPVSSVHAPSWADFITTTPELKFSVHTPAWMNSSGDRSLSETPNTWLTRNIRTSTRVSLSEALERDDEWSHSMTKSKLLGLAAILSAAIVTPVLAAGETTTRPWSAPVGHRQPRAADVPTSTSPSQQTLDQEDANVDRKISNVCRGC